MKFHNIYISQNLASRDDHWPVSCNAYGVNSGDGCRKLSLGKCSAFSSLIIAFVFFVLLCPSGIAATVSTHTLSPHKTRSQRISESQAARRRMRRLAKARAVTPRTTVTRTSLHRRHRYYERFSTSSFASDVTDGDVTAGEDPVVRDAAIDALGGMNG